VKTVAQQQLLALILTKKKLPPLLRHPANARKIIKLREELRENKNVRRKTEKFALLAC
jgi:hypothetical protein